MSKIIYNKPYFRSYLKKDISRLGQGITIIHLYNNHLKSLNIPIPHKDEQKKIAEFLSAIDKKITQTQITATKSFKQGLLQKMFI